ncbi:type I restriction-modification system M protein [Streptococcus pneumoniae]|nr:type I restriction-modification system M protein [Streptococcus pneumoniae]VIR02569.1 type I restriction-modification system M protein [Streptococcus pneumoniae]VNH27838.1 type I restriction-modification system M protein [Streptococcus pneumoniae]VNI85516.1 type I restriction-modification system M protein [Streptococcus pneumoniae]VPU15728.1 type I restriction-modification system M protein [Streptococcus pneumoniae]
MSITSFVKRIQDITRNDAGVNGDAQRIEQMSWLLFLPVRDWWENREEILEGKFYKSKSFTPSELAELNYNLDQCGFPKEEEEILNPFELIQNYQAERATLNHKIDNVLADILQLLEDK